MVSFEADTAEAASEVIAGWVLSEGCTVNASMVAQVGPAQGVTDGSGAIVEAPPPEAAPVEPPAEQPPAA